MIFQILHRRKLLLLLIFLVLIAGGILLFINQTHSQPKHIAHQFFLAASEGGDYESFLLPQLKSHPLPILLQEQNIEKFQIKQVESRDKDHRSIWASATFTEGLIPIRLDMTKYGGNWMVTGLSEVSYFNYGIPIEEKEKIRSNILKINLGEEIKEFNILSTTEVKAGQPISFVTVDGLLAAINPLQPIALTKVLSLSKTLLEDEEMGRFPVQGEFPVFTENDDTYEFQGYFSLPAGTTNAILYCTEDQAGIMAVTKGPYQNYNQIRVLLQTSEYTGFLHDKIEITSQDGLDIVSRPNGLHLSFEKGQSVEFRMKELETELYRNGEKLSSSLFRWNIRSKGKSPLVVKSIVRDQANPSTGTPYQGTLEITVIDEMLILVNELDIEEYLTTVVPSEMPVKFGLEALKVQAVAARSYVARAIHSSGYRSYGAHLDDSIASQVYNNINKQDISSHAVRETTGMVAVYDNEIVDTRFFSTSSGYTANYHEVWSNQENEFPSNEIPYLTANPQYTGKIPDLYREENFRAFLNQPDLDGYDQFSPFFRWKVLMTREQLEAVLSHSLPDLYQQQSLFVLTKTAEGTYKSKEIPSDIGILLNIEVLQRGEGGNMMEMEITTTHGVFKIIKEYNIRQALKPVNYLSEQPMELLCQDGSIRENFSLLPSAFAYIDFYRDADGNISELAIRGGGYGHGVGMSQYGAYGLTLMGKTWKDILKHYYPGSELHNLYAPHFP